MNAVTENITQVSSAATHTALNVWNSMGDFLIVLVILSVFFLFAYYVGRGPFVALLLSFYCAYALYAMFPYASYLPTAPALTALFAHVGLYAGFCLMFYIILRRVVVSDFLYVGLFGLAILSLLGATFLVSLAYHLFPISSIYTFTPAMDFLFSAKTYFFWWFSAPAIGLFFLAR